MFLIKITLANISKVWRKATFQLWCPDLSKGVYKIPISASNVLAKYPSNRLYSALSFQYSERRVLLHLVHRQFHGHQSLRNQLGHFRIWRWLWLRERFLDRYHHPGLTWLHIYLWLTLQFTSNTSILFISFILGDTYLCRECRCGNRWGSPCLSGYQHSHTKRTEKGTIWIEGEMNWIERDTPRTERNISDQDTLKEGRITREWRG